MWAIVTIKCEWLVRFGVSLEVTSVLALANASRWSLASWVPGWQFAPLSLRAWLLQRRDWGWMKRIQNPVLAMEAVRSIRLLSAREMRVFVPGFVDLFREDGAADKILHGFGMRLKTRTQMPPTGDPRERKGTWSSRKSWPLKPLCCYLSLGTVRLRGQG